MQNQKLDSAPTFAPIRSTRARSCIALALASLLSACASVDFDYPKTESHALTDAADTHLGRQMQPLEALNPDLSGFYLQLDGVEALASRGLLAQRAERTLDAQYYLITNDTMGSLFIGALLKAADRGVRVRLLLDDIQTQGYDAGMAALDSHPHFEVRIFNPFAYREARLGNVAELTRVNRRMHNKSMTADNEITIIGGRNIANEYFAADPNVNFGDVDVVGIGPVVRDVSAMFDSYWNHPKAAPVPAFAKMPADPAAELERLRAQIEEVRQGIRDTPYAKAFEESYRDMVEAKARDFIWAPYEVVFDSPDKIIRAKAKEAASIVTPLREAVLSAERELIIVSPYFVPLKSGVEFLTSLQERGVQVIVVTNSLAATNHAIVHSGYAPYRKALLEAGVRLLEVRHDAFVSGVKRGGSGASLATLHTKGFVVDRKRLFLGSFNWDPRSVELNTELGVIIDSPELAEFIGSRMDKNADAMAFEVILDEKNRVRWADRSGEEEVILDKEPQAGFWRRFSAGFSRILPIRRQL